MNTTTEYRDTPSQAMHVRAPGIQLGEGRLLWSKVPEFAMAYNAYSVVIPYVEYYLNNVMNRVRLEHCADNPELKDQIGIFVKQEINHSRYHVEFNKRMFDEGIEGLQPLIEQLIADLKQQREQRSLAFNAAYCAGFESIATFDSKYLYEECDAMFDGADAHGANLLLWHVAEEFEHRTVCHDAFHAVSGRYFERLHGLLYAFWHVGGAFLRAEALVLKHYTKDLPEAERKASIRRSKALFWRQLRYVAPRMLRIFLPGYNPAQVEMSARIQAGLDFFHSTAPITQRVQLGPRR
jgi:predicted metal-dependent hydrolase